jgi:hypothetical protein
MQFPSFAKVPMSPRLDQPGVKVLLGAASFKANEPAVLYGAYSRRRPVLCEVPR